MENKQVVRKLRRNSRLYLKRNSSTILTAIGALGVVATTVVAVRATPKAMMLLNEAKEEKGDELTKLEVIKVAGPTYIPSIAIGVSTIACVFGANALNKRQQAALMSAYALLDSSYKDYKNKVKELYGEEADKEIVYEIAKEKYNRFDIVSDGEKQLFYDYFSERYFESTVEAVQRAEYQLNRKLMMEDGVYLNDWYEWLGIEPIESGYSYGWSSVINHETTWQAWVDFIHDKVEMDDGLECHIITFSVEPLYDFEYY